MHYLLAIVLTIFLAGCVPGSDHPLTDPDKAQIDASILGTWYWQDENESGFIHIGRDETSKLLRVIMVDFDRNGELEASEFFGHTSLLDGSTYLNLRWVRPPQSEIAGYIIVKYAVNPESLGIALMDSEVVEEAIKSGALQGSVKKEQWSYSIHITEGQEKLQGYIRQRDKALFRKMQYVQKLQLPN